MNNYWRLPIVINKIGRSHQMTGQPCQDAFFLNTSKNKQWIVAVVCDGAGSAKRSLEGAELASKAVGRALLKIADKLDKKSPGHWINDEIIQSIIDIRMSLRNIAGSDSIADFHTTLVAILLGPSGGVSIHVGDGAIFGANIENKEGKTFVDCNFRISQPENGEYANETYFLTEADWIKHLRINPLPSLDWFSIGSDGGCSIALQKESELREQFFVNLFNKALIDHADIDVITDDLYENNEFDHLTNDDITLITVISNKNFDVKNITLSEKITPSLSSPGQSETPRAADRFFEKIQKLFKKTPLLIIVPIVLIVFLVFSIWIAISSSQKYLNKNNKTIEEIIENDKNIEATIKSNKNNNAVKPKQDEQ